MSLQTLLDPATKQEQWSLLNCYHLNVANLDADQITSGALAPTINDIPDANITLVTGTGTVGSSKSITSRYKNGNLNSDEYVFLSGSFLITGVQAPQVSANNCLVQVDLNLPFKIGIPTAGFRVGGGTSANVRDTTGDVWTNTMSEFINNAGNLRLNFYCTGNISGASATRTLACQYFVHYNRAA